MDSIEAQLSVADRLWAWFELHKREVVWVVLGIVIAGMGVGFYFWRQSETQNQANEALARVVNPSASEQGPTPEALLAVTAQYGHTDAGARALLLAAAGLYTQGKYPEARTQFERFMREYRGLPMAHQALLGLAACLDAEGKTANAIAAYNDIVQHYASEGGVPENVVPQARLALGWLYEREGKLQQARDLYMELARNQYGSITSEAGIHLENILSKHPELIPNRPAVTNMPALHMPRS